MDFLFHSPTKEDRLARAVKSLAKKIKIKPIKDSNLIEVTYKSPDPQLSYNVLKSLGDLYMAKHVAVHRPAGSFEFFSHEADKYRAELQQAEDKLRSFGRQNAIAAPNEQRTQLAAQVADSVGILHQTEQSVAADKERIKDDLRQMSKTPARSQTMLASSTNDKLIDDLNTALLAAETKRTQLALKFDTNYPLVKEADQEIAQDKAAVARAEETKYVTETTDRDPTYELLREDAAKSQADLSAQRATLVATKHSIESIQAQMVNLDQLSVSQQDSRARSESGREQLFAVPGQEGTRANVECAGHNEDCKRGDRGASRDSRAPSAELANGRAHRFQHCDLPLHRSCVRFRLSGSDFPYSGAGDCIPRYSSGGFDVKEACGVKRQ